MEANINILEFGLLIVVALAVGVAICLGVDAQKGCQGGGTATTWAARHT
jgi:hypothetical protein